MIIFPVFMRPVWRVVLLYRDYVMGQTLGYLDFRPQGKDANETLDFAADRQALIEHMKCLLQDADGRELECVRYLD
jgi:hypothetical protein